MDTTALLVEEAVRHYVEGDQGEARNRPDGFQGIFTNAPANRHFRLAHNLFGIASEERRRNPKASKNPKFYISFWRKNPNAYEAFWKGLQAHVRKMNSINGLRPEDITQTALERSIRQLAVNEERIHGLDVPAVPDSSPRRNQPLRLSLWPEECALLRAICEQPDEDTVRMAYADWLDEQGDPLLTAHADFIRFCIQWDGTKEEEQSTFLPEKEHRLMVVHKHGGQRGPRGKLWMKRLTGWTNQLPDATPEFWHRGLPYSVVIPSIKQFWRAVDDRLFLRIPFEECSVLGRAPRARRTWIGSTEIVEWVWFCSHDTERRLSRWELPAPVFGQLPTSQENQSIFPSEDKALTAANMAFIQCARVKLGLSKLRQE